ncbi:MAG: glycosyltransferase family 2 protein [Acidobacteriaceae bacterium]
MRAQAPVVSIGLPVYNGESFVAEAIRCVLAQTFSDWELIVCDNASTDRTVAICREFAEQDSRIRVYESPRNMGVTPNFNRVFQLSRGRYFKWIAHDDLFSPEFIEVCLQGLEQDEGVVLSFPTISYVDAAGHLLRRQTFCLSIMDDAPEARIARLTEMERKSADIFWSLYGVIRRDVLERTSLHGFYAGSDQVLLLELALSGRLQQVDKDMFFRREHPAAATLRRDWTARDWIRFAYADDKRRIAFPYCRMLKEHLATIRRSDLPFSARMRCICAVLARFATQWKYFAEEAIWSPLHALRPVQAQNNPPLSKDVAGH